MVFNGLGKSDLVVFNALRECDLTQPLPTSVIARLTSYHIETVRRALLRLDQYGIIARRRDSSGRPYQYSIKLNGYVIFNP